MLRGDLQNGIAGPAAAASALPSASTHRRCTNQVPLILPLHGAGDIRRYVRLRGTLGPSVEARKIGRSDGHTSSARRHTSFVWHLLSGRRRHRGSAVNGGRRPSLKETRSAIDGRGCRRTLAGIPRAFPDLSPAGLNCVARTGRRHRTPWGQGQFKITICDLCCASDGMVSVQADLTGVD